MKFQKVKGTRDILPEEWNLWEKLLAKAKKRLDAYGYDFITTPTFERTELFVRSIGEVTDIVEKEMYTFTDRGGRSLTLRPEGTAPVVRAYLENRMIPPVKLAYFMNMFRAERPQKGRYREFWHLGVEAIGIENPLIDAEIIKMGYEILTHDFGIEGVEVNLNTIGTASERKVYRESLRRYLSQIVESLCDDCQRRLDVNPLRVLDCKVDGPKLTDYPKIYDFLEDESKKHFDMVKEYLEGWSVPYKLNPRLVRGLDYYTRTAFEFILPGFGAQDAIGGGGRYDGLVKELGGSDTPAIGFAIGMDRVSLSLQHLKEKRAPKYFIATVGEEARVYGIGLMEKIRRKGIRVEFSYEEKGLKAQMKLANRLGSRYTIIIGEDELNKNKVKLRDMETGEESLVDPKSLH